MTENTFCLCTRVVVGPPRPRCVTQCTVAHRQMPHRSGLVKRARLRHQRPAPTDTPEERVVPRPGIYARPPREEAEERLRTLVGRDCELCFVFTPSTRYSHQGQFQTMFPSIGDDARVQVDFLEGANHVFTLLASQDALRGAVERWMGTRFLGSAVPQQS